MDRIRLSNNVTYPIQTLVRNKDILEIHFRKNVFAKTIPLSAIDKIRIEDRKGKLLGRYDGFNTIIYAIDNKLIIQKLLYTEEELAQQAATDADINIVEAQQFMVDAETINIESQQNITDTDIERVLSEQNITDFDIKQDEQGQSITETELELLLVGG